MEQDLISKKELLELTDISYGQLYRWKRERLLPEDWFIKQASYTGQETFFPRAQMLERINAIKELKDTHSLEMIASIVTPQKGNAVALSELKEVVKSDKDYLNALVERLAQENLAETQADLPAVSATTPTEKYLSFSEVVFIAALGTLVEKGLLLGSVAINLALESRVLAAQWTGDVMGCAVIMVPEAQASAGNTLVASWHLVLFKQGDPPIFSKQIITVALLPLEETSALIKRTLQKRQENIQNS
ncbi:MAG: YhbD family protein [Eggerthellaceae bacterium]|nr:YhbD family protein [Eggerthellaceae bacterium]